jgi:hypothetical protein
VAAEHERSEQDAEQEHPQRLDPTMPEEAPGESTPEMLSQDRQGSPAREMAPVGERSGRIDPAWPEDEPGDHPVSELAADRQGSLSPFGSIVFPVDASELPYDHPHTEINWE